MNEIQSFHTKMSGEYRAVINAGTDEEIDTGWMSNLVLNSGKDRIGSGSGGMFNYCSVGTGTTAPAAGQTSLVTYIADQTRTSSSGTNLGASTYASQYNAIYTFSQGAVTGNIAEFGVGWATGGVSLFSRCLIVDTSGSPTTITLTTIDQLTVYYRLTLTPTITDLVSSVTLAGTSYPYTARLADATSFFGGAAAFETWIGGGLSNTASDQSAFPAGSTIGAITGEPSGSSVADSSSSVSLATYTNGNYYRDATLTVPPADFNTTGGIGALVMRFRQFPNTGATYQYVFSTAIPKDNRYTLSLTLRSSWS